VLVTVPTYTMGMFSWFIIPVGAAAGVAVHRISRGKSAWASAGIALVLPAGLGILWFIGSVAWLLLLSSSGAALAWGEVLRTGLPISVRLAGFTFPWLALGMLSARKRGHWGAPA